MDCPPTPQFCLNFLLRSRTCSNQLKCMCSPTCIASILKTGIFHCIPRKHEDVMRLIYTHYQVQTVSMNINNRKSWLGNVKQYLCWDLWSFVVRVLHIWECRTIPTYRTDLLTLYICTTKYCIEASLIKFKNLLTPCAGFCPHWSGEVAPITTQPFLAPLKPFLPPLPGVKNAEMLRTFDAVW